VRSTERKYPTGKPWAFDRWAFARLAFARWLNPAAREATLGRWAFRGSENRGAKAGLRAIRPFPSTGGRPGDRSNMEG